MIFYHGTNERCAREIEECGWLGSIVTDDEQDTTLGNTSANGVVFLATNPELAAEYGDVIFAIDTDDAVFFRNCPVTGEEEYVVPAPQLNEEGAWWIVD